MIRINAFFELADGVTAEQALEAVKPMINGSRAEVGNVAYDLFESQTRPGVMVFVETWKDSEAVSIHGKQPHFLAGVQSLKPLMKGDMKIEQFSF